MSHIGLTKGVPMLSLEKLEKERDQIMLTSLAGGEVDFSRLRELCKEYQTEVDYVFATTGTDEELWNSVITYFRDILKRTTQ